MLETALGLWVDPQSVFAALYGEADRAFWLDCGVEAPEGVSAMGAGTRVSTETASTPILDALRSGLAEHADVATPPSRGFTLGWVGWLGYELRARTMGEPHDRVSPHPDAAMMFVDRAITFDHASRTVTLIALGEEWRGELATWRDDTISRLRSLSAAIPHRAARPSAATGAPVRWAHDDATYLAMIEECKRAITAGDAYQLCLTTAARVDVRSDDLETYLALRDSSPAHHGGLLRFDAVSVLSASPERFLAVRDGTVETRPIKGTRARGADAERDLALRRELRGSEKEQAENLMIVDLMRNDLSRVCELGSVEVSSLFAIESYAHVHQLVSTVRGRLREGLDAIDAIETCFPAGSMTGAPKREATRILDRLEGRARGIYSGAFGYLGVDGRLDLAMVIRSIVLDEHGASVGAGGGITALSDPHDELAEVKIKADALLRVLVGDPAHDGPRGEAPATVSAAVHP